MELHQHLRTYLSVFSSDTSLLILNKPSRTFVIRFYIILQRQQVKLSKLVLSGLLFKIYADLAYGTKHGTEFCIENIRKMLFVYPFVLSTKNFEGKFYTSVRLKLYFAPFLWLFVWLFLNFLSERIRRKTDIYALLMWVGELIGTLCYTMQYDIILVIGRLVSRV